MRKEDLATHKKYRHPMFNFDLYFDFIDHEGFSRFYWIDSKNKKRVMHLVDYELDSLTKVREKIKVECDVWINVDENKIPDENFSIDKVFELNTDGKVFFNKKNAFDKAAFDYKPIKFKATFEEVDDD